MTFAPPKKLALQSSFLSISWAKKGIGEPFFCKNRAFFSNNPPFFSKKCPLFRAFPPDFEAKTPKYQDVGIEKPGKRPYLCTVKTAEYLLFWTKVRQTGTLK